MHRIFESKIDLSLTEGFESSAKRSLVNYIYTDAGPGPKRLERITSTWTRHFCSWFIYYLLINIFVTSVS